MVSQLYLGVGLAPVLHLHNLHHMQVNRSTLLTAKQYFVISCTYKALTEMK